MTSASNELDVLITGLGVVSAAGLGWRASAARRAVSPTSITSCDPRGLPARVAFQVEKLKPQPYMRRRKDLKLMSRDARLALVAAGLAVQDAGIDPLDEGSWPSSPEDVALYMGVGLEPGDITELGPALAHSMVDGKISLNKLGASGINLIPPLSALRTLPNMALAHVSINLGLMGRGEALSPWGTAGFDAVAAAAECIARGECEMALAGAADSDINLTGLALFLRMGLLAEIDERGVDADLAGGADGLILGEGGAFFVLESRRSAERRGATPMARISRQVCRSLPTPVMSDFKVEALSEIISASVGVGQGEIAITGAAGHDVSRRAAEERAIALAQERVRANLSLEQVSSRVGWCCAAQGMLDLADRLARERVSPQVEALVGTAWAPTGHYSTLTLDQIGDSTVSTHAGEVSR